MVLVSMFHEVVFEELFLHNFVQQGQELAIFYFCLLLLGIKQPNAVEQNLEIVDRIAFQQSAEID